MRVETMNADALIQGTERFNEGFYNYENDVTHFQWLS